MSRKNRECRTPRDVLLARACDALATLVRDEYPDLPLAEIAETWGDQVTPEQVEALVWLEAHPGGALEVNLDELIENNQRMAHELMVLRRGVPR
jgi:hypothetical protein